MKQDLLLALRTLRKNAGWTVVVLLSLALGIGANTALFTAVNGVLLQTVPVPDPGSLVRLKWAGDNDMVRNTSEYGFNQPYDGKRVTATFSYPGYLELRKAQQDAHGSSPRSTRTTASTSSSTARRIWRNVATVTGNYFTVLRVRRAQSAGVLAEDDDQPGAPLVGSGQPRASGASGSRPIRPSRAR